MPDKDPEPIHPIEEIRERVYARGTSLRRRRQMLRVASGALAVALVGSASIYGVRVLGGRDVRIVASPEPSTPERSLEPTLEPSPTDSASATPSPSASPTPPPVTIAPSPSRVPCSFDGFSGAAGSAGGALALSASGRVVAFVSEDGALVWRDRCDDHDLRSDVARNGSPGNGRSLAVALSGDGRYVAFWSNASNLVANDTNSHADVFVRDMVKGVTERVSIATDGRQSTSEPATMYVSISADARFVSFSTGPELAPSASGINVTYVRDRVTRTTTAINEAEGVWSSLSRDGAKIGSSLKTGEHVDAAVFDRDGGSVVVSPGIGGAQADADCWNTVVSGDGKRAVFESIASNLVAADTNARQDIFLRDLSTGTTTRVSVSSSGAQGSGFSVQPAISGDGRFVAFRSSSPELDPTASIGQTQDAVFVHDVAKRTTTRISKAVYSSSIPALSLDGRFVAYLEGSTAVIWDRTTGRTERVGG